MLKYSNYKTRRFYGINESVMTFPFPLCLTLTGVDFTPFPVALSRSASSVLKFALNCYLLIVEATIQKSYAVAKCKLILACCTQPKGSFNEERNICARCTHWILGCQQGKLQEPLW